MPPKRKADSASTSTSKKARSTTTLVTQALVASILADPKEYPIPDDDNEIRKALVDLATYARGLEEEIDASKPKAKSAGEIAAAVEKLRSAAVSGIKKQMGWKPSCKTGSARWVYDGVCADAEVFGAMLGLGGPPTFKTKKMTSDEFQNNVGQVEGSVRYSSLYITSDVNIHWKADEGTFKFSGSYGVPGSGRA